MTATEMSSGSASNSINSIRIGHSHHQHLIGTSGTAAADLVQAAAAQSFITAPNSPSSSSSTSKNNGDATFEPTVDMMVNDFDDEQTLEEEEALAARESEDATVELSNLQKESDMPIEELLALYNCDRPSGSDVPANSTSNSASGGSDNGDIHIQHHHNRSAGISNRAAADHHSVISGSATGKTRRIVSISGNKDESSETNGAADDEDYDEDEDDEDPKEASQLRKLYPETYGANDKRLLRTISRQQSDEEEDDDYSPDEDEFKKTIMVGSEFQAVIPEGFFKYDDVLPYENEDKLLWDPSRIGECETEQYLQNASQPNNKQQQNGVGNSLIAVIDSIPVGNHLRDDEQALYLLLQCGHNTDEALRRKRINAITSAEQMSIWSEDECRNFESGIRIYGKDFHTIQYAKVRTRSVGELVQFYYLWKKTERHDIFANKSRLEKKKYSLHPGLTDYMDRFLEEQEGNNGNNGTTMLTNNTNTSSMILRDRSSSPGNGIAVNNSTSVHCLIQADNKRNSLQTKKSSATSSSALHHHDTNNIYLNNKLNQKDSLALDDVNNESIIDNISLRNNKILSTESLSNKIIVNSSSTTSDLLQRNTMNQ